MQNRQRFQVRINRIVQPRGPLVDPETGLTIASYDTNVDYLKTGKGNPYIVKSSVAGDPDEWLRAKMAQRIKLKDLQDEQNLRNLKDQKDEYDAERIRKQRAGMSVVAPPGPSEAATNAAIAAMETSGLGKTREEMSDDELDARSRREMAQALLDNARKEIRGYSQTTGSQRRLTPSKP